MSRWIFQRGEGVTHGVPLQTWLPGATGGQLSGRDTREVVWLLLQEPFGEPVRRQEAVLRKSGGDRRGWAASPCRAVLRLLPFGNKSQP